MSDSFPIGTTLGDGGVPTNEHFELPTVAALRQQLAEYEQLFELQHTRTREADERWRAEDPETRKAVHPDLGVLLTWLMADADNARAQLAKAERERDSLARRLGIRFEETKQYQREIENIRKRFLTGRRLAETFTVGELLDAFRIGPGPINEMKREEPNDTRMTLTDKAAEYLDTTGSAITGGRSFGDEAGEVSSDSEITANVKPVTPDRYMMATRALHKLGDISRDTADLARITGETATDWIGNWVEGYGYINVHFPKATTRPLTADEIAAYDGHLVEVAGHDNYVIRIGGVPNGGRVLGTGIAINTSDACIVPPRIPRDVEDGDQ